MKRETLRRMLGPATVVVVCSGILMIGASPRALAGQTYWRVPGALGGALAGTSVAWMMDIARWGARDLRGPELTLTPFGMGIGGVLGFIGGLSADERLARGDTLTRGGRAALRMATFLAPVAVGGAVAFAVINPSDEGRCVPYTGPDPNIICTYRPPEPKVMSDEMVFLTTVGGGAVVGFIAQHRLARALWPRARVGIAPDGRGVAVSIPLGW